jgi:ferrochelatase
MSPPKIDSVLLVGFGGPTPGCCHAADPCPGEAYCFVHGILGKSPARDKRAQEVAGHYRELGGFSPYNELTFAQASALEKALAERGTPLKVDAGFRHWRPYVKDALEGMRARGLERSLAVVLAPHQSTVSWDWYIKVVGEAQEQINSGGELGARSPEIAGYLDPWWRHEGFIEANVERIRERTHGWDAQRFARAALVFTAHSIPMAVARTGPYTRQFAETASDVASRLGVREFVCAYQSGPDDAAIPWTEPTIGATLDAIARRGSVEDVVVVPVGFLCDHVEVLYDLDVEARAHAAKLGLNLHRVGTVGTHPAFVGMLADLVAARVL